MAGRIETEGDAVRFLRSVKFALRYNPTPGLPLASMYAAAGDQRRAIELTNALLASGEAVETNVVAERLVLAHRDIVPALYALRCRFRADEAAGTAARVLELIRKEGSATAGDARRFLGVAGARRPDAADLALTELMHDLRIDRGPSSVPVSGMPYLSREGYPYRIFETAHPELVKQARKVRIADAIAAIVAAFDSVPPKKVVSMFKLCLSDEEMRELRAR
jgi:hypothetical protein